DGVELTLGGELGQVAAELVEQLRALRLLAGSAASAALLAPAGAGEHADDLVADLLRVGVEVEQDPGGDALVLAYEAEQDVLRADVVVLEGAGLVLREDDNLASPLREPLEHWSAIVSEAPEATAAPPGRARRRAHFEVVPGEDGFPSPAFDAAGAR